MDDKINEIIAHRQGTHGVFTENSATIQATKDLWRSTPNWSRLRPFQREALDMVAHKAGRILHGDPDFLDHWEDPIGYLLRVVEQLRKEHEKRAIKTGSEYGEDN